MVLDFCLYLRSNLSLPATCLWLVNVRSSFPHLCVERPLVEQGNLFRAPYFINLNIDASGEFLSNSSGIKQ